MEEDRGAWLGENNKPRAFFTARHFGQHAKKPLRIQQCLTMAASFRAITTVLLQHKHTPAGDGFIVGGGRPPIKTKSIGDRVSKGLVCPWDPRIDRTVEQAKVECGGQSEARDK